MFLNLIVSRLALATGMSSSLARVSARFASRGMGGGMGGGGHANNPVFMFQADWSKNKWKPALMVGSMVFLGFFIPYRMVAFAQRKAGVEWV